ncbi:unnamed protein product [Rotaria sp. Silwood2]|nr:unnamed protein product [Rotaria sp. Silwood2]CAF4345012.1 unnamed protein product [Rotaria sp. Silwood2]
MPPKARLEQDAFEKALQALSTDEVAFLDRATPLSDIWGHLCLLMGKANNKKNQRACFDLWNRKQYQLHNIVNNTLQTQQSDIPVTHDITQAISSDLATHTATATNNEIKQVHCSSLSATEEQYQEFMKQLCELLYQQQKNIPVICTHDVHSVRCSGDIVAIKILCKCAESSDNLNNQMKKSSDIHLSNDSDEKYSKAGKNVNRDSPNPQLNQIISNNRDFQDKDIESSIDIMNTTSATISPIHTPPRLFMSPTSSSSSSSVIDLINNDFQKITFIYNT